MPRAYSFSMFWIGVPHGATEDTTIKLKSGDQITEDFLIPKSSMVVALHWHMNRNPDLWGSDANEFHPERFLSYHDANLSSGEESKAAQPILNIPPHFMPFQVIP